MSGKVFDEAIKIIEGAKEYCSDRWYEIIKSIITKNENIEREYGVPKGIIHGELKDSEEIQSIITKDWTKIENLKKFR